MNRWGRNVEGLELRLRNTGGWLGPDRSTASTATRARAGAWTWKVRTDMTDLFEDAVG